MKKSGFLFVLILTGAVAQAGTPARQDASATQKSSTRDANPGLVFYGSRGDLMPNNQTTPNPASLLRHFAQFQGPPVDNAMVTGAHEIDRLRADMDQLVGLDVTTREGQAAFALWRNRYQHEKRQLRQRSNDT